MWKDLPENEKEEYKRMILAFASLTELFSQKNEENDEIPAPIINSKYQETIFQKAFHASAEDMHDWNELHTEYSYKDKMFLNEIWSKYGWLHFKNLLYVINQMHITELLPEIILPLNESLRKCGENYADCKEMIKANAVIINKIITKAFLDFNDDIKCDHELVKAFEEVLETLVGFGMEEAAVILDEFRVH